MSRVRAWQLSLEDCVLQAGIRKDFSSGNTEPDHLFYFEGCSRALRWKPRDGRGRTTFLLKLPQQKPASEHPELGFKCSL